MQRKRAPQDPGMSVVHLTMRHEGHALATGSGVLFRDGSDVYLVTAWHNVTGRHSTTLKPLHSASGLPNNVVAWIACDCWCDGQYEGVMRRAFTIPLEAADRTTYLVHEQQWPRVDVAVVPLHLDQPYQSESVSILGESRIIDQTIRVDCEEQSALSFDVRCIQDFAVGLNASSAPFLLAVADEIYVLGYPKGITDQTGQPIWKRASVATCVCVR